MLSVITLIIPVHAAVPAIPLPDSGTKGEFKFEFPDSKNYTISYEISLSDIIDIEIDHQKSFTLKLDGSGPLDVKIPRTVPKTSSNELPVTTLVNNEEVDVLQLTDCHYLFGFGTKHSDEIKFIFNYTSNDELIFEDVSSQCKLQEKYIDNTDSQDHKSPLMQLKQGIPLDSIQCKEGLELIFKSSNGFPACVKPETKQKLIERGWATNVQSARIESDGVRSAYDVWISQGMITVDIDRMTNTVLSVRVSDSTHVVDALLVEEGQKKIVQIALSNINVEKLIEVKDYLIQQVRHNGVSCDNCVCPEDGCALVGFSTVGSQKIGVTMTVILNSATGQVFDIRTSQAWYQS